MSDSGKKKLPFNKQKPRAEPRLRLGSQLPRPVGFKGEAGEKDRLRAGGKRTYISVRFGGGQPQEWTQTRNERVYLRTDNFAKVVGVKGNPELADG